MQKVFTKKHIILITLISLLLLISSTFIQYHYQVNTKNDLFISNVNTEIRKSLNKKIFEIEASLTSIVSFYQASDDFNTSTFGYVSKDLIKNYPTIESIIYAQIVYEDEKTEFYEDMYNNGLFNFKIKSKKNKEFYLPITNITPDSYKYTKYFGDDILDYKDMPLFLRELAKSSKIAYSSTNILNKKNDHIYLLKSTYFGTNIPKEKDRLDQVSGYFIFGIDIEYMLQLLEKEFPSYLISLDKHLKPELNKDILKVKKIQIDLPSTKIEPIYIYYPIYFSDLNISEIATYNTLILIFILILIYVFYSYKKHLIYKTFSQEQLYKSEKMVSMGEMIGNISHQWRQPLSAISMIASGVQLKQDLGILEKNEISKNMRDIVNKTNYLSETINIFRDFIKEEKNYEEVYLEDRISQALSIVNLVLNDNNITINDKINYDNKIKFEMVVGELDQVIINILNNAKDILLEKKIEKPYIELNLIKETNEVIITIEDNAGGIPNKVLPKIFEPYFTTKHKSVGTGLGLHMSYKIITESLKGKLYAKNTQIGAKFYIHLPLKQ